MTGAVLHLNPGSPVGLIALEIGARGRLSDADATDTAAQFREAAALHPGARLVLHLDGYDDDPRELWHIPEAGAFVRRWAELAGLSDWRAPMVRRLHEHTLALFVLCEVFEPDHPFRLDWPERGAQ